MSAAAVDVGSFQSLEDFGEVQARHGSIDAGRENCQSIALPNLPAGPPASMRVRLLRKVLNRLARDFSCWHSLCDGGRVRELKLGQVDVLEIMGQSARANRTILYFHGGGHKVFSAWTHREIAGRLSAATRSRVLSVDYRLCPENPFPAALEDALEAWREACKLYPPESIAIAGDSAGGNLAFALLVKLAQLGQQQPAACLGMAPWLLMDAELLEKRRRENPLLPEGWWSTSPKNRDPQEPLKKSRWASEAEVCIESYCQGHPSKDPLVSPLLASEDIVRRFPPILLHLTDEEPLTFDSREMASKCRKAGVTLDYKEYQGRTHVFQAFPNLFKKEAADSFARMSVFLDAHWSDGAHGQRCSL
mmetsp:Transcript_107029/g.194780  ORF Transcript_107029/g.194780 Transcript_107029/m.194780 type:complete len:362 (-) Transcript_107029:83-1168(-)